MSKLKGIKTMLQRMLISFSSISTDKGLLRYDSDNELPEIGESVYLTDEEGNETKAEDGEYIATANIIVVKDGKVDEIRDKEPDPIEEPDEEQENAKQKFERMKVEHEDSYEDKEQKIINAIRAKGFDCWLMEAGDDFAIVEVWSEESMDYTHYRFPVSWDAEGNAEVGDPEEVKSEFVPVNEEPAEEPAEEPEEKQENEGEIVVIEPVEPAPLNEDVVLPVEPVAEPEENPLALQIAALEARLAAAEARILALEGAPAATPAVEEFSKVNSIKKTSDEKMNNLLRIINAK